MLGKSESSKGNGGFFYDCRRIMKFKYDLHLKQRYDNVFFSIWEGLLPEQKYLSMLCKKVSIWHKPWF